ncbi:TRAP transporter small permease subunit [Desulforhopalus singaporensis]|uniref:TRAP-type mannitol/chloroaromatic compound transport system, small permease component n=1 Tax=Desulforhopalus singaporensis TaxID=91360 RepID=A0A1H0SKN7_9BACT|nr:TRAP transporter small permease subunit [Desulforhopalus singaporensis]SDP42314.1 TRAP-type mannitol/chloroaromatic compound transport system, small permease component [Desulforhopalus singaporensis]
MKKILEGISWILKRLGDICSLLILVIMGIVSYEVIARYGFNSPTSWAWLINKQLFGVFVMVAGGYALVHHAHIRIEILYQHFSPKIKVLISWLTFAAACCFLGALLWKSTSMGLESWESREVAMGIFKLPLYPLKLFMPVGTLLFLLGCVVMLLKKK